jgi:hypothetical protein
MQLRPTIRPGENRERSVRRLLENNRPQEYQHVVGEIEDRRTQAARGRLAETFQIQLPKEEDRMSGRQLLRERSRTGPAGRTGSVGEVATERGVPLCVDLDGSLVKTDLFLESLLLLLKKNLLYLFLLPVWLLRGKAVLKQEVSRRVTIDVKTLPYQQELLAFLRKASRGGGRLSWRPVRTGALPSELPSTWACSPRCSPATARST